MKRIVLLFLCVVLMGSMTACKNDPEKTVNANNDPKTVVNTVNSDSDLLDLGICKFADLPSANPNHGPAEGMTMETSITAMRKVITNTFLLADTSTNTVILSSVTT